MKIIDLINAGEILNRLVNQKMPAQLAYAMAKNVRLINREMEIYDQARLNLLKANWELNPKTNLYDIPDEDQTKWQGMINDLVQNECDYQPYKVDFKLAEKMDLAPADLLNLWFIFDGDDLAPAATVPAEEKSRP